MEEKKTAGQLLEEKLLSKNKAAHSRYKDEKNSVKTFADGYIAFLNTCKTERETVRFACSELEKAGFSRFDANKKYKTGDKIFFSNRGKSMIAARVGSDELKNGLRIIASHIDSPRLDLKPHPLYEDSELGYLKSHYYGGIKKYQWATIPLAMHGVVIRKNGESVDISLGEKDDEPVFYVSDLLPHLSRKTQDKRTASEVIKGEELNILMGNEPIDDDRIKEPVKLAVMKLLNDRFGIVEEDFISAEIEFVPAMKARYVGLDGTLIGGYAQDDRICAYSSFRAFMEYEGTPEKTLAVIFADKEEIGSDGNTGLASDFLKNSVSMLCRSFGAKPEQVLYRTKALSSDVSAAFDPNFSDVYDKRNCAFLNHGPSVERYTGSGGKYNTSEAGAEYMAFVRNLLDESEIPWQSGELGKVDEGGGGTVAMYIANLGADVVDFGAPILSMHSPYEVSGALDLYSIYKAYGVFYLKS